MKNLLLVGVLLLPMSPTGAWAAPPAARPPELVSTGKEALLTDRLIAEKPTVVVFYKPTSSLERGFLDGLHKEFGARVAILTVQLKTGAEPVAKQHSITETPTARLRPPQAPDGAQLQRGRDQGRDREGSRSHADRLGRRRRSGMEEVTRLLGGRKPAPGILRTMSLKPEYMAFINDLSRKAHFADGFIDRRTKEMVATYVSALNKCKY
jgi:hypothetical protein